ncbi:MAG TPA: hypothetical protein VGA71_11330 [Actinomycetota bacterium]
MGHRRLGGTRWLVVAVGILAVASLTTCKNVSTPGAISPSATPPNRSVAPSPTASEPAPDPPLEKDGRAGVFAGTWFGHGRQLSVDGTGLGTLTWRTYTTCGQDPPPCDTTIGNEIFDGGGATVFLASITAAGASGRVVSSNTPDLFPVGPLTVRLDTASDLLYLSPTPFGQDVPLCGPKAAAGACGA